MSDPANRREFYRFVVDEPGRFRVSRDLIWLPCQVLDLSGSGARIAARAAVDDGMILHIEIPFPQGNFRRYAEIVSHLPTEDQRWHKYRLRWIRQSGADQDALVHALFARERAKRLR